MEPKLTDRSGLLWARWLREQYKNGTLRSLSWCSTSDQLADSLTKPMDGSWLQDVMKNGQLRLQYSFMQNGRICDGWKGLLPKRQAHECSMHYLQALHTVLGRL